jgi:hypothetical protein
MLALSSGCAAGVNLARYAAEPISNCRILGRANEVAETGMGAQLLSLRYLLPGACCRRFFGVLVQAGS